MAVSDAALEALASNPLAETVRNQRAEIARLQAELAVAEKQVRDLSRHNAALQRDLMAARSGPNA